jgi:hypothetical protein
MDLVQFSLWRFRNVEGVMKYVTSFNMTECQLNVKGEKIKLEYNPSKEEVEISYMDNPFKLPIIVSFKDFVKTMTDLGFYELRPDNERHSSSWGPKEE